ncbi:MAG: hypothetical protein KAW84_06230 [Thermoplasmata archaeon]|nr:hypothetical protein [Thermoplasmata archaeon]
MKCVFRCSFLYKGTRRGLERAFWLSAQHEALDAHRPQHVNEGNEHLPPPGPVEELVPDDLLPEYSEFIPPPAWATPEVLGEKVRELNRLIEEASAFLAKAKAERA